MNREMPYVGFDLDGTLIDTTAYFETVCIQTFNAHDIPLTPEKFRELSGTGKRSIEWFEMLGVTDPVIRESILCMRDASLTVLLESQTMWLPGARDMLQEVRERQKAVYVVTNSQEKFLKAIRSCLPDIDELITGFVCADTKGILPKPHQSGIQHVMGLHGCSPNQFLYVGDQLFDHDAAKAAGTFFCAYQQDHTHEEAVKGAHFVIQNIREVPGIRLTGEAA